MTTAIDLGSTKVGALTPLSETSFMYERFQHDFGSWVGLHPDTIEDFQNAEEFQNYLSRLKKLLGELEDIDQVVATAAYRYLPKGEFQKILWKECGLFPLTISIGHEGELLTRAIKSKFSQASSVIGTNFVHLHVGGLSTEITFDLSEFDSPIQRGFEHFGFSDPSIRTDNSSMEEKLKEKLNQHEEQGAIALMMRNLPPHTKLVVSGRYARQLRKDSGSIGYEIKIKKLQKLKEQYKNNPDDASRSKFFLCMFLLRLAELGSLESIVVSDARMAMGQIEIIRSAKRESSVQSELSRRSLVEFQYSLPFPDLSAKELEMIASLSAASNKKTIPLIVALELLRPKNEDQFTSPLEDLFVRNHFAGIPREIQLKVVRGIKGEEDGTAKRVSRLMRLILSEGARVSTKDSHLEVRAERPDLFKDPEFAKPFNRKPLKVVKL